MFGSKFARNIRKPGGRICWNSCPATTLSYTTLYQVHVISTHRNTSQYKRQKREKKTAEVLPSEKSLAKPPWTRYTWFDTSQHKPVWYIQATSTEKKMYQVLRKKLKIKICFARLFARTILKPWWYTDVSVGRTLPHIKIIIRTWAWPKTRFS